MTTSATRRNLALSRRESRAGTFPVSLSVPRGGALFPGSGWRGAELVIEATSGLRGQGFSWSGSVLPPAMCAWTRDDREVEREGTIGVAWRARGTPKTWDMCCVTLL